MSRGPARPPYAASDVGLRAEDYLDIPFCMPSSFFMPSLVMPSVDCFVNPSLFFVPSLDMDSLVVPSFCMPPLIMLSWARAARDAAGAKAAATITDAILDIGGLLVRGSRSPARPLG